jgi:hypothetical protein
MLEGTLSTEADRAGHTGIARSRTRRRAVPKATRREVAAWLSAISLAGLGRPRAADPDAEAEATAEARAWLEVIDSGHPAVSWTAAAPTLRDTIGAEEWTLAVRSVRAPLGPRRSRSLLGRATVEAFPGMPPGPYAVIHFQSDFEERPGVVETVTTCLGDDGRWRVAAYFMR